MKLMYTLGAALLITFSLSAQTANPKYDPALATQLGADDYGMKQYILVILKTGSGVVADQAKRDSLFAGHINNMNRLVSQNKLIVAGPIAKNEKSYRGIFILNVQTFEESELLLDSDPAIKEKLLEPEMYHWYGSAALPEYIKVSDKIWKVTP